MSSIYEIPVDPDAENDGHSFALSLIGYDKTVLEVGCSTGFFTKVLAERGCNVVGIEPDPEAAEMAGKWAERVVVGNIDERDVWNEVKDESFDVVVFGDVLEHLLDPLASLREAVRKIKPTGFVVTCVHNVAHGDLRIALLQGKFRYAESGLLDETHLRFFTLETLRELLGQAGLVIVDTKRVVVPLFHSELGVNRGDVDHQTLDALHADPELECYQYVMRSVRDNGDHAVTDLAALPREGRKRLSSIYEVPVDPDAENNGHAFALSLIGYNKSVLEVGCSTGFFTKVLAERGCNVVGIELDPEAAEMAGKWAERVVVGNIDERDVWNEVKDESFDVVVFGDVLEHLLDPLASLREAVRKIKPTGFVVTCVPNVAHGDLRIALLQGKFRYAESGLLDETHLRFFTLETLRELLGQAGLVIVDTKRVVVPLFHSELGVNRGDVDHQTLDALHADPELECYQYVMRSVRDNGDHAVTDLAARVDELTDRLHDQRMRLALLRGGRGDVNRGDVNEIRAVHRGTGGSRLRSRAQHRGVERGPDRQECRVPGRLGNEDRADDGSDPLGLQQDHARPQEDDLRDRRACQSPV